MQRHASVSRLPVAQLNIQMNGRTSSRKTPENLGNQLPQSIHIGDPIELKSFSRGNAAAPPPQRTPISAPSSPKTALPLEPNAASASVCHMGCLDLIPAAPGCRSNHPADHRSREMPLRRRGERSEADTKLPNAFMSNRGSIAMARAKW